MTTLTFLAFLALAVGAATSAALYLAERRTVAAQAQQIVDLGERNDVLFHTALEAHNVTLVDPEERRRKIEHFVQQRNRRAVLAKTLQQLEREHAVRPEQGSQEESA